MKRRLSAVLLALGLTVSALSTGVYAAETETTAATEQVTEAAQTEAATEKATEAQTEAAVAAAEEELTELASEAAEAESAAAEAESESETEALSQEEQQKQSMAQMLAQFNNYTDEQLEQMLAEENTPKEYYGKSFTTYEALQEQRRMERNMRATRQQIKLLQEGEADEKTIILKKARYQGQCQVYKDFSDKMGLPQQKQRILQDGLRGRFAPTKRESAIVNKQYTVHEKSVKINVSNWKLDAKEKLFKDERSIRSSKKEKAIIYDSSGQIVFKKKWNYALCIIYGR